MKLKIRSVSLAGLHIIDGPKLYAQHPEPYLTDAMFKRFSSLLVPKTELCGRACWFYESFTSQLFLFDSEELSGEIYDRNVFRFTIIFTFEVVGGVMGPCIPQHVVETDLAAYTVALLSLCEDFRQVEQRHAYLSTSFKQLPSAMPTMMVLSPPFPVAASPADGGGPLQGVSPLPVSASVPDLLLAAQPSSPVTSSNAFLPSRSSLTWNALSDVLRMVFNSLLDSDQGNGRSVSSCTSLSSISATEVHLNSCYSIHISLIRQRVNAGIAVRPHLIPVVISEDSAAGGREAWSDITLADLYSAIDGSRTVDDIARLMGLSTSASGKEGPTKVCGGVNRTVAEGLQQLVINDYVRLLEPVHLSSVYNTTAKLQMTVEQGDAGSECRAALAAFGSSQCGAACDESQTLVSAILMALHSFVYRSVESVQGKMRNIPQFGSLLDNWHQERLTKIVELGLLNEWLVAVPSGA